MSKSRVAVIDGQLVELTDDEIESGEIGECDRCGSYYSLGESLDEDDDNPDGLCIPCREKDRE